MAVRAKGVVLAAAIAASCGSGDEFAGMTGRQVAVAHDINDPFFADPMTVVYTRAAENTSLPGPEDMWVWGLSDAAPAIGLPNIDWTPPRTWPLALYGELLMTGPEGRLFYDFTSRTAVDLYPVMGSPVDASVDVDGGTITSDMLYPPIALVRRDGQMVALTGVAAGAISVGPATALAPISVPGAVGTMGFLGGDLALLYVPTPESDASAGIYRLAVSTGHMTELVAPTPIDEWVGTIGGCSGLGTTPCPLFAVAGCLPNDPPCPGQSAPPCVIVYVKADPDNPGHTAPFAYDVNVGRELKLPGVGPTHLYVSPDQQIVLYDDEQFISKRYWSLCGGTQDFCPLLGGDFVVWRPDSRGFVSVVTDGSGQMAAATIDHDICNGAEVMPGVFWASYAPAGDRLAFLVSEDQLAGVPSETMFLAGADGSAPQPVATGSLTGGRFSPDGTKLFVARSSSSSLALDWLDLTVSPPAEHQLAGNYAGFSRGGNRRVLLIDHWNTQDTSGELALIDVATGARQGLGRAVSDFTVWDDVDAGGANVAYVVRSRVASPRDGLWLTTLPP
jgi:hypothetical protein